MASHETIPFDQEWDLMSAYLKMEEMRFADTLTVKLNKTGDFSDVSIPPLILQPIVENSIKHNHVMLKENGFIHVNANKIKNLISIEFIDNGKG